jgi:heme-degrading monooxygenase HmoA
MVTITKGCSNVNIMVIMDVQPDHQQELADLAVATQRIFEKQPGFVSGVLFRSTDGERLIQYLQWESMEAHLACVSSPDFQVEAGKQFMSFIQSGKAEMEPQVYEVISLSEGTGVAQ